jgi:type II secretory pathway component PulJ
VRINTKLKAFTLSEMIVVMLITTIVVGLAFSVLRLIQRQMTGIKANFNTHVALNKLEQALYIDFNRYGRARYNANTETLVLYSEIDSMSYAFTAQNIIRLRDTFNVELQEKQFFLMGESVVSGQVDALTLQTTPKFLSQKLFVYKHNDATLLLNDD